MNAGENKPLKALKAAFPHTIPIFSGFWCLGIAYGIYMNVSGFSFWYPLFMSILIFGGSLEFVAVTMLLAPFAPLQTALMTVLIQARHLFYGIALTVGLHLWRRQMLLSFAGGCACYMLLLHSSF